MADTYNGQLNRVRLAYGLNAMPDHKITILAGFTDGTLVDVLPYVDENPTAGWDFTDPTAYSGTLVDWINQVIYGLTLLWSNGVQLASITSEVINTNGEVIGLAPIALDATLGDTDGSGGDVAGMSGQYFLFQGYNAAGRISRHMIGGVSGLGNAVGDSFVANPLATAGSLSNRAGDFLARLQKGSIMVGGGGEGRLFGTTNQLDIDIEYVPLVGSYSSIVRHGQHDGWVKFGY